MFAVLILPVAQVPGAAAKNNEWTDSAFSALMDEIQASEPLVGPESFELEHDPSAVAFHRLYAQTADFLLTLEITNPYDGDRNPFDFGIRFRAHGDFLDPTFMQISVDSHGVWWLESGTQSEYRSADAALLDSGRYHDLDTSEDGSNTVAVYAEGNQVVIAINGAVISAVEAPFDDLGDVMICTGIYDDNWQRDAVTGLEDITVWSLD